MKVHISPTVSCKASYVCTQLPMEYLVVGSYRKFSCIHFMTQLHGSEVLGSCCANCLESSRILFVVSNLSQPHLQVYVEEVGCTYTPARNSVSLIVRLDSHSSRHLLWAMQPVSFMRVYSVFMLGLHAMLIQHHWEKWFFDCSCTML